jgi:hypothetical protein
VNANVDGLRRTAVIRTTYEPFGQGVVPRALWIEISGPAVSLASARQGFQHLADLLASLASLSVNAAIEMMAPALVLDITPTRRTHEMWQLMLPTEIDLPAPCRRFDNKAFDQILTKFESHLHRSELTSALAHYRESTRLAVPGSWLMSAAHSWIAFEALKVVALEQLLFKTGASRAQAAAAWNVKTSQLLNESRLRLLFAGRAGVHERLRDLSNDLEHALVDIGPLQAAAEKVAVDALTQLRRSIVRLIFEGSPPRGLMRQQWVKPFPYARPQRLASVTLVGVVGALAPDDLQYPHIDIVTTPTSSTPESDGRYTTTQSVNIQVRRGDGVGVKKLHYEILAAPGTEHVVY